MARSTRCSQQRKAFSAFEIRRSAREPLVLFGRSPAATALCGWATCTIDARRKWNPVVYSLSAS